MGVQTRGFVGVGPGNPQVSASHEAPSPLTLSLHCLSFYTFICNTSTVVILFQKSHSPSTVHVSPSTVHVSPLPHSSCQPAPTPDHRLPWHNFSPHCIRCNSFRASLDTSSQPLNLTALSVMLGQLTEKQLHVLYNATATTSKDQLIQVLNSTIMIPRKYEEPLMEVS